ncbi:MAG: hypothetical protein Q9226_005045 [Calogaya cf. arnoldii]
MTSSDEGSDKSSSTGEWPGFWGPGCRNDIARNVAQDDAEFLAFDNAENITRFGTTGLNACTAIIITAHKGVIVAHIHPIEYGPRVIQYDRSLDNFFGDTQGKVLPLYVAKKEMLEAAKITNYGDAAVPESYALSLDMEFHIKIYTEVEVGAFNDAYMDAGNGEVSVKFDKKRVLQIVAFGEVISGRLGASG